MINNTLYMNDIINSINNTKGIEQLKNKKVFITGATGLIGSYLVDLLMHLNNDAYNITVIANARDYKNIQLRFSHYESNNLFKYYIGDVNDNINYNEDIDIIINCASNTHPKQYSTDPIGTIMTNINGTNNVLSFANDKHAKKVIFLSSVEIYGENINNIERFKENDMGYINCNTLRAGYNEAKRAGEALCQAYIENKGLDISIVRLPRIFGPTVKKDDSKVMSQFINKALLKENIVLKSEGTQFFSYLYVADAVSGILTVLNTGKIGEVYNLGNIECDVRLVDLANEIANIANTKVVFELPDEIEKKGFSKASVARLDYSKISNELGWTPSYSMKEALKRTINILEEENNTSN